MQRQATIERVTKETSISLDLLLDQAGTVRVETAVPFLDHMLTALACHGRFSLSVKAKGDLDVDAHHTVEDIGLVLGQALRQALGEKRGIQRYGCAFVPMDEALARVVVDLSGRPFLGYRVAASVRQVGGLEVRLFREFFQALVNTGGLSLHIDLLAGDEGHHIFEAIFKAFGRALGQAVQFDPCSTGVPSTKGVLE